jgi:predicted ATP-dependent endonuclease of OLD family
MATHIDRIVLTDVNGIGSLDLQLAGGLNIVCGTNGVGKTSLLEAIAQAFTPTVRNSNVRLRTGGQEARGSIDVKLRSHESRIEPGMSFSDINKEVRVTPRLNGVRDVIYFRTQRDLGYSPVPALQRDPAPNDHELNSRTTSFNSSEIKAWFANRYLLSHHGYDWPAYRHRNLESAKRLFSLLDSSVSLERVDTSTFDVMVSAPSGVVPFEYMSSGFRSVFTMLLGMIKEIEYRGLAIAAEDFDGLIMIDEIDLHLHPSWQRAIAGALKDTFPKAQIIATTHSPHVIQSAREQEIIALERCGDAVRVRHLPVSETGFVGWTIEEILQDVMGVSDTQTPEYREAIKKMDDALDNDNREAADQAWAFLDKALHPSSVMRKVIAVQMAAIGDDAEDAITDD